MNQNTKVALAILGLVVPFTGEAKQESFVPGERIKEGQLPSAYNQNASYAISDGWNVHFTGDYIYWHLNREDPDLDQDTEYRSGFQVGMGFEMKGMDNWNVSGQYTWYRNSPSGNNQRFIFDDAHFGLSRAFYLGKKITANFSYGFRGLWLTNNIASVEEKSWAIGPRLSFDSNWLLGCGFRFIGDVSQSVLYTRYTTLRGTPFSLSPYDTLRPITEIRSGVGFGSYIGKKMYYHFDLKVIYEFGVLWNQYIGAANSGVNIYLHGLNIGMRFDF